MSGMFFNDMLRKSVLVIFVKPHIFVVMGSHDKIFHTKKTCRISGFGKKSHILLIPLTSWSNNEYDKLRTTPME